MIRILALDTARKMGWAIRSEGIASGVIDFGSKPGKKFLGFSNFLESNLGDVDVVYYEKVRRHLGTAAAHAYGGFQAILQMQCFCHNIPLKEVSVGEAKKMLTGKGNAKKHEMIQGAIDKGFSPVDDNEADAIAILLYGIQDCDND